MEWIPHAYLMLPLLSEFMEYRNSHWPTAAGNNDLFTEWLRMPRMGAIDRSEKEEQRFGEKEKPKSLRKEYDF